MTYTFSIPAVIAQFYNPTGEFVLPIEIPTKEEKVENETNPVTAENKISNCSIKFKALQTFLCFLLIKSFLFISFIN